MRVTRNQLRSGHALFAALCEVLERRFLFATALPDMPAVVMPASDPALPAGFDTFTPPVTATAPLASARRSPSGPNRRIRARASPSVRRSFRRYQPRIRVPTPNSSRMAKPIPPTASWSRTPSNN